MSDLCTMCKQVPVIYDQNKMYPTLCSRCEEKIKKNIYNMNKDMLTKLENKRKAAQRGR